MNTEMLCEEFKAILKLEEKAKTLYEYYLNMIDEKDTKEKFRAILKDELRHIGIAKALINMFR